MTEAVEHQMHRIFAIPELVSLILSFLPPTPEQYAIAGPEADDHRSQLVKDRAGCLLDLLRCHQVCRGWHRIIRHDPELQSQLFLVPKGHEARSSSGTDAQGRSWTAADTISAAAPAPQALQTRRPQSATRVYINRRERHGSPTPADRSSFDTASSRREGRSASSNRAPPSSKMHHGRPLLNPLLQTRFEKAGFNFNWMHARDSASRYQAQLIIERADFVRWNRSVTATGDNIIPTWYHMQLASPPITAMVAVVWGRVAWSTCSYTGTNHEETTSAKPRPSSGSFSSEIERVVAVALRTPRGPSIADYEPDGRIRRPDLGSWDSSGDSYLEDTLRPQFGAGSGVSSHAWPVAAPPSAFDRTRQVQDDEGLTMGMLLASVGEMFRRDPALNAVKVCTP